MADKIYRGYEIKLGGGTGTRYFIYDKNGVEVYSMTATEEEVYDWIDKEKRKETSK